uniref:Uncharacterized protein n=1 Tax=Myoviridae sp. ctdNl2 TaxID=2825140 RepID=A0A8S5QGI7_9CAUD|nr:MAG TPA: hypothetical protein [Myoviridae sp. ctdNl2]
MNLLKKISVVSILMVSMGTVGYGATVVVPRVSVVRVPKSRPTVNTPKPSVTKSTSNTFNKSSNGTTPKSSESKSFSESSGRSSFFDSMSGAITGSWLYNSLFNNHYSSNTNDNKESPSNGSDDSCGLWDWITNNIEYLKRVLLGE